MSNTILIAVILIGSVILIMVIALMARAGGGAGVGVAAGKPSKPSKGGRPCGGCNRNMLPTWTSCMFCKWTPGATLEFIAGPMKGQRLALGADVTTIGSVAGNTVVLADPAVSKKHAGIRKVEGGYELADFGSTNGVYVNGQKVPKKALVIGDIVRVGNTEAVFKVE
jgi:hypothetical protein